MITGGAGAIGGAVAARLAREGASVRILDLAEPTTALFHPAADVDGRIVDVADCDAVSDALSKPGWSPDLLVNVAGVFDFENVLDPAASDWDRTLRGQPERSPRVLLRRPRRACASGGSAGSSRSARTPA